MNRYMPQNEMPFNVKYIKYRVSRFNIFERYNRLVKNLILNPHGYSNQLFEYKDDFAIFSNEVHDVEFVNVLGELASDAEETFPKISCITKNDKRGFEEVLADSNFSENFEQFFGSKLQTSHRRNR